MKPRQIIHKIIRAANNVLSTHKNSAFTPLIPVDNAHPYGCYAEAISFALDEPRIFNIALSGPYGSGKSSIIRTYEKKNKHYKFLNISLASFKEDSESPLDPKLIERSILQQMLYGADANKLPCSRFKRITKPKQPLIKSILMALWPIITYFLYSHHNDLLVLESYTIDWLIFIMFIAVVISIPTALILDLYKSSFGLLLKKISLKNAEIETCEIPENSILNRHLDEIIYFFQVTNYDVVVIEDLDRFGNPEIFVKLREINKIINDNKNHGRVRFLYALKDDMFTHDNRAKFFDFIIPIVPIINSSNSLDKMLEHIHKHEFAQTIDKQLLRDVSLYISDLRLIHNIFNELFIYYDRVRSERLEVTKLFAMMVYKNVYPDDFDSLHHKSGALFEVCNKKSEYLESCKNIFKERIKTLKASLASASKENTRNIQELIDLYIGYIVRLTSQPVVGIVCENQHVLFSQFKTFEQFEPLLHATDIQLATQEQNIPQRRVSTNKSFSQIEDEINPGESFLDRKANIENVHKSKTIKLQQEIRDIERKIDELSHLQLFQLIQRSGIDLVELVKIHLNVSGDLLIYLVSHGYLDDTYHLYISNFHEGRLTNNDRDYLLTIHSFKQPDPTQAIDTPAEVCTSMRKEDFEQKYVLNVTLIDYLLQSADTYPERIKSAMRYISQNPEQSEALFSAYFLSGKHLEKFIRCLSYEWPNLVSSAISSKHKPEFVSHILKFVEADYVVNRMNTNDVLTNYLSEHGDLVLDPNYGTFENYEIFKTLGVKFYDLSSLTDNAVMLDYAHEENLYTITPENVDLILDQFSTTNMQQPFKPEEASYTFIRSVGSDYLKEYIEANLPEYIKKVFLYIPTNSNEDEASIRALLTNESLDNELKCDIISKQCYVFESFDSLPEEIWSHMLLEAKVKISWQNISDYMHSSIYDSDFMAELMDRQDFVDNLSSSKISIKDIGNDKARSLSKYIFYNNEIGDSSYCSLLRSLPYWYSNFPPEISDNRIRCIISERKVQLTEDSYNYLDGNNELIAFFISNYFDIYLKNKENYPFSDEIRELLLQSNISDKHKVILCLDVTPSGAMVSNQLCDLVARILVANTIDCSKVNDEVLELSIINAKDIFDSIKLLIKCLPVWDEARMMKILAKLPRPYSEISSYGNRPKLNNNKINLEFAQLLEQRGFISSINTKGKFIRINTFKSGTHDGS